MDKSELMRAITEPHQRMADAFEQMADEQLHRQAMDDWTARTSRPLGLVARQFRVCDRRPAGGT